jgi:uncharacterized membrane protein YbaN (DUF454 family)
MLIDTNFLGVTRANAGMIDFDVAGPRIPATAATTVAPPDPGHGSADGRVADAPWIACCERSGAVEIHDPRLLRPGRMAFCRALVDAAVARFGAIRAEVRLESATCRLEFEPGRFDRRELAGCVAAAVQAATPAVRDGDGGGEEAAAGPGVVTAAATGEVAPRRLGDLAMAAGALALAVAGAVLPGIPALPFLIVSGRHAARLSPRIERLLQGQPWCAALLAEADARAGEPTDWRSLAKTVGLAALCAAAILILHPPMPLVFALEMGVMALLAWKELRRSDGREPALAAA